MAVITISRHFGAGGRIIADKVAEKTGFLLVNQEIINKGLNDLGLPPQSFKFDKSNKKDALAEKKRMFYLAALHEYITTLAAKESIILLGRGGQFLFQNHEDAFHVRIQAPLADRIKWVQDTYKLDEKTAAALVKEKDRAKVKFTREVFKKSWTDIEMFDLVINTGKISPSRTAKIITQAFSMRKIRSPIEMNKETDTKEDKRILEQTEFMHPSEKEFAQILDFYKIRWQYEPRVFNLKWDKEGNVTEAFAPDFYLPDLDLFIELTTQKQKLVSKKNQKLRKLKELYPDVNIRIFYGRNYHSLLKKLGLE